MKYTMTEQLISFETAKLAKEKGFKEKINNWYIHKDEHTIYVLNYKRGGLIPPIICGCGLYPACSQSLLQKWLRDTKGIFVLIDKYNYESPGNFYFIPKITFQRGHPLLYTPFSRDFEDTQENTCVAGKYKSTREENAYEEALEIGLFEALKLIL